MRIFHTLRLMLVSLLFLGCHSRHPATSTTPPPLKIATVEARADSITPRYRFSTHLDANSQAVIQPRVNGYLLHKSYPDGGRVREGELLFTIESSTLRTTLRSAEAALSSAEAELATARKDYERAVPLAALEAISESQLDAYRATYLSAEGQVESAREQVEAARLQVGYASIYSPLDGVAAQSQAQQGDYVGPATQFSVLTTIVATDTLSADIALPTSLYLSHRDPTQPLNNERMLLSDIRLYLTNGQEYAHKGSYDFTRQAITPTMGTVVVVVTFPNPDSLLKVGEYGEVECGIGPRRRVITLPQQAIQTLQNKHSVWVIDRDSVAQWREVSLGEAFDGRVVIESGVLQGERVAIEGGGKLRQGAKVIPQIAK